LCQFVLAASLHEAVRITCFDKEVEVFLVFLEHLIFYLRLFDCQLKHESILVAKLVFEGVRKDAQDVKLTSLVETQHLFAQLSVDHFHVELGAVQHFLLDVFEDNSSGIFHLSVL